MHKDGAMKKVFSLFFLFLVLTIQPVFASLDKIGYEDQYTKIVKDALNTMFGEDMFLVRVSVQMTKSSYQVKYTQESNPKLRSKSKQKEKVLLLPGYPVIRNLSSGDLNKLPFDSVTTYNNPKVSRVTVDIIANKAFPKSKGRRIEPVIRDLLKLKANRDKVNISYKKFYRDTAPATQNITISRVKENTFSFQNILFLLMLLLLIAFLAVYIIFQKKGGAEEKSSDEGSSGGGPNISVNPNFEMPKGSGGGGPGGNIKLGPPSNLKQYFNFVSWENVHKFKYILKQEQLKVEQIANIISFIPPDLGVVILDGYEPTQKASIATKLADQKLIKREEIEKLEKTIQSKLECLVGGKALFEGVFDLVSNKDKNDL